MSETSKPYGMIRRHESFSSSSPMLSATFLLLLFSRNLWMGFEKIPKVQVEVEVKVRLLVKSGGGFTSSR